MRRWQRELDRGEPDPFAGKKCACGQPAAPQAYLLMGYCSRLCMLDSLGETDSDVRD